MKTEPTNVRLTPETLAKIKLATELSGKKSAEIMRLSMDLGLRRLEAFGYNVDAMTMAGIEAAEQKRGSITDMPSNLKAVKGEANAEKGKRA